jgi:soluble lytic murein transglycosylase-like protein
MGGDMSWGKFLIISLGLIFLIHVAHAGDIESFTDSQGILHITNLGAKKPGSPANPPGAQVPLPPRSKAGKAQVTLPAKELVPEAQAPSPKPEAAPTGPVTVDPKPGSRVTHTEGSGELNHLTVGTGEKGQSGRVTGIPAHPLKQISYSPPQPVRLPSDGATVIHRDHRGVIHITNISVEVPPPLPVTPAPALQKLAWSPDVVFPAVQEVSCPELGPEVAEYLRAKLLEYAGGLSGNTVHRYRDDRGVWQIINDPSPDPQSPQAQLAAAGEQITAPALAQAAVRQSPPAMPWVPGLVKPSAGVLDPKVVASRDHRGVLHIFTGAAEFKRDGDTPLPFLAKVSPALQACIIEAAQLYQLPVSLILAIIRQESNFTYQALSPKGAMGLMQLMPGTAASLGVRDPFDPRENILGGCRYFRFLLNYFQGSVPLALAGYNAGHHRVVSAGCQVPAIKETREFVSQVMGLYYLLEKNGSRI